MLVESHVAFRFAVAEPSDGGFQHFLAVEAARDVVAADFLGGAVGLAEVALGVGSPGAGIDGIAEFLLGEAVPGDVDGTEPA